MTRPTASDRLARILTVLPWIAANDGPLIDDVAARFGLERAGLLQDLNVASFVGLPPYSPDELIEVIFDDERVWVTYPRMFDRPLRLTNPEGLAVVAAGAAARSLPGADPDGPLATGLAKVATVLGLDPQDLDVDLGDAPTEAFDAVQRAISEQHPLEIEYFSFGRDERTTRVVEPWRMWSDEGNWYVSGHCRLANGERVFRLDRISSSRVLDEDFEIPAEFAPGVVFNPSPDMPRVTLDLSPQVRWVVENYPADAFEERPDGSLRVVLAVTARPWLERLLLTLGPDATVVDIDDRLGSPHVAAEAAARVLRRYDDAIASSDRD
ncbi:MAG TPA: WYL domain-containing protein [Acidimicrobiales bacterium]|jgi:proteasome accessory factor C|nr:WYL domain-containing protein [Acidimicrobiales bacterium]